MSFLHPPERKTSSRQQLIQSILATTGSSRSKGVSVGLYLSKPERVEGLRLEEEEAMPILPTSLYLTSVCLLAYTSHHANFSFLTIKPSH